MGQTFKYTEPTIWALRKNTRQLQDATHTLYEHLYGYDPIKVARNTLAPETNDGEEAIRKGSAENPELNILNPNTNFTVMKLASDGASKA